MKKLYNFLFNFFPFHKREDSVVINNKSFSDYSRREQEKLMNEAGKEAQKEQLNLIKAYEAKFGSLLSKDNLSLAGQ